MPVKIYLCQRCEGSNPEYASKLCAKCIDATKKEANGMWGRMRFCCRRACNGEDHCPNCQIDYGYSKQWDSDTAEYQRASTFLRMQELTMAEIDRQKDAINNPEHYTKHPSGVECITVTEHMSFCLGNVIKYVWRASLKGGIEDLQKARWYIEREIELQQKERARQLKALKGEPSDP